VPRHFLALVLVAIACPAAVAGSLPPGKTVVRPAAGGRFTFVMLAPMFHPQHTTADELKLRWKHPRSGLYETVEGGRPRLKWAVDWYSPDVYPAADGVHVARVHTQGAALGGTSRDEKLAAARKLDALSLYANGKLVKAFAVGDLFDVSRFSDDQLGAGFSWGGETKLDDAAGAVTVRAATGEWATVSFRSREVVDRGRPADPPGGRDRHPWWAVLAAGVGVVGIGGAVLFLTAAALVRRADKIPT
jgi:hypothetical protein